MTDFPRLIEHAFPLKQASLDSVHEKNVRHGHISTLHIWPARRPLAACRAALIATLLPDPSADPKPEGMTEEQWQREVAKRRQELCEKIGGKVVKKIERKKMPNGQTVERIKEETEGGILHWGRETENVATLESLRSQIIKAYGGRAPKVLDPFAGGGAIPLEAMRLGCEATAVDINPVAWFIQKCTLEYPQRLAGKTQQLPDFILSNDDFMQDFFKKAKGYGTAEVKAAIKRLHDRLANKRTSRRAGKDEQVSFQFSDDGDLSISELQADLAWHVRAWGNWVFDQARRDLAQYYPTYADFEPLRKDQIAYEHQPTQLLPLKEDGTPDIDSLNADFTDDYLEVKANPRWLSKPTVAYLWARTIECKNCRAIIPLLKSRWLSKKSDKRVLLGVSSDPSINRVLFTIETNVPSKGGNAAQRREHDKRIGAGTMSRSGAWCPCCKKPGQVIMTMEDIRVAGQNGLLGSAIVAVAVNGPNGKEFRLPSELEVSLTLEASKHVDTAMDRLPFGPISELTATKEALGFRAPLYGFDRWRKYFTDRQMLSLGGFVYWARATDEKLIQEGYPADWSEAIRSYLGCIVSRTADYMTQMCVWEHGAEEIKHLFMRWALPMTWDFAEANPLAPVERFFLGGVNSAWRVLTNLNSSSWNGTIAPSVINRSAIQGVDGTFDIVFTDPPYYDAIPYSDLMDFFLVWLKRGVSDISAIHKSVFNRELSPKWNAESEDGELIDDSSRHKGDSTASKKTYEDGMFRAFQSSAKCLRDDGHMVVVFANKKPDAWETLAAAVIRAGFCVNGSWPIVTEMPGGLRNLGRASLASSVWLVCKKRPTSARPGWDNNVLEEMRKNISVQLREFWDAGIRGPDFVWAATGPAMEAYSKHPVVRKANEPNATMGVGEFLNHVRRMVVDYVVGQVLSGVDKDAIATGGPEVGNLDEVTAYYLLHRHDFGTDEAPVGACILYATACGLSDTELERTWDILSGGTRSADTSENEIESEAEDEEVDGESDPDVDVSGGGKIKLKAWNHRRGKSMGYDAPEGKAVPMIDRIHRLMHLWKDGDLQKVDDYIDEHALRRNELFKRVVQSLIELSTNSERSTLESISNHIGARGAVRDRGPTFDFGDDE